MTASIDLKASFLDSLELRGIPGTEHELYARVLQELAQFLQRPPQAWTRPDLERFLRLRAPLLAPHERVAYGTALAIITELVERLVAQHSQIRLELADLSLETADHPLVEDGDHTDFLSETIERIVTRPRTQPVPSVLAAAVMQPQTQPVEAPRSAAAPVAGARAPKRTGEQTDFLAENIHDWREKTGRRGANSSVRTTSVAISGRATGPLTPVPRAESIDIAPAGSRRRSPDEASDPAPAGARRRSPDEASDPAPAGSRRRASDDASDLSPAGSRRMEAEHEVSSAGPRRRTTDVMIQAPAGAHEGSASAIATAWSPGGWIEVEWQGFVAGKVLRDTLETAVTTLRQRAGRGVLADMRQASVLSQEDAEWFADWLQRSTDQGLRRFAIVNPERVISRMQLSRLRHLADASSATIPLARRVQIAFFDLVREAREWLGQP